MTDVSTVVTNPIKFEDDPTNSACPYFLHYGESPRQKLVGELLSSRNYHTWSRSMFVALTAKNKQGFIDGSIREPKETEKIYNDWRRCDYMVLAWITASLSPEIVGYTAYATSAFQVWKELRIRFARSNNNRIYSLEQKLKNLKQERSMINIYFAQLKIIWDEIDASESICVCTTSNCPVIVEMVKREERKRIMQFLMGLNESYVSITNQLLLRDPLPSIDEVFNLVSQEESNQELKDDNEGFQSLIQS